ncbi:EamA family transporter [Bacillus salipaludis]
MTESAIFINLNPFFALVGAVLFLGEKISSPQIVGFLFILLGVLLGQG